MPTITVEQYRTLVRQTWSEKEFQERILELARPLGWVCYHVYDARKSVAGFPDLVLLRPPVLIFAELKVGKNKLTKEQQEWLALLRAVPGIAAYVWRPEDWDTIMGILESTGA